MTSLLQGCCVITHHHKDGGGAGNAAGTPVSLCSKDKFAVCTPSLRTWLAEFGLL